MTSHSVASSKQFCNNIHNSENALSFTSLMIAIGKEVAVQGGVYSFWISGGLSHCIGGLLTTKGLPILPAWFPWIQPSKVILHGRSKEVWSQGINSSHILALMDRLDQHFGLQLSEIRHTRSSRIWSSQPSVLEVQDISIYKSIIHMKKLTWFSPSHMLNLIQLSFVASKIVCTKKNPHSQLFKSTVVAIEGNKPQNLCIRGDICPEAGNHQRYNDPKV